MTITRTNDSGIIRTRMARPIAKYRRQFMRKARKNVRVNGETALFHQEVVAGGDQLTLLLEEHELHVSASDFWEQREDYGVV